MGAKVELEFKGDFVEIKESLGDVVDSLNLYIGEISRVVKLMSNGDLTALVELLEPYGKIIQSNTDGIIIIPENKDKVREVVSYWEQQSYMTMEIDIAHTLIQKDVNNYILFVDNNNKDTYSLIEDCAKIGVKVEVINLLKEFKNIYNHIVNK